MDHLSEKEQKIYDWLVAHKTLGKEAVLFQEAIDVFGERVTGTLGKLKQLGLIDINKNCRIKSTYGTKFPKVIVLKKPTELKPTPPDIRILGEGQEE